MQNYAFARLTNVHTVKHILDILYTQVIIIINFFKYFKSSQIRKSIISLLQTSNLIKIYSESSSEFNTSINIIKLK